MASVTLLLPQPLGPTIAVTPSSKASSDRSENDLKPEISRRSRRITRPLSLRGDRPRHTRTCAAHAPVRRTGFRCVDYRTDLAGGRCTALGEQFAHRPDQTAVSLTRPSPSGKAKVTPQYFGLGTQKAGWCTCYFLLCTYLDALLAVDD